MSDSGSGESRSTSPEPDLQAETSALPPVQTFTPVTDASSLTVLPCQYQPSCPDQCPAFEPISPGSKRCICNHIHSVHRLPTAGVTLLPATAPLPEVVSTPTPIPVAQVGRWTQKASIAKQKVRAAQAEVNAGYLSGAKGKGRATASTPVSNSPASSSNKPAARIPKGQGKSLSAGASSSKPGARSASATRRDLDPEPVKLIVFIEHAYEGIIESVNNQGEKEFSFTDVRALDKSEMANLRNTPLGRFHSPQDKLWLDPNMDAQQTAEHLAACFSQVYDLVKTGDTVPQGWFIPLVKKQRRLHSIARQVGATAYELLFSATTEARKKDSREIYLAIPIKFTKSIRESLGLPPSKRKVSDSESDTEVLESKIQRTSATGRLRVPSASVSQPRAVQQSKSRAPSRVVSRRIISPPPASPSPAPSTIVDDTETRTAPASPIPTSPTLTEVAEADIAELEEATSSFVLEDREVVDLTATTPPSSPFTRSKQRQNSAKVSQDLVLAALMNSPGANVFSHSYNP